MNNQGWHCGSIWHERFTPKSHKFKYADNLYLTKIPENNKKIRLGFFSNINFSKYGLKHSKLYLKQHILSQFDDLQENSSLYEIFLLTRPSQFGIKFNPISFYFIYENKTLIKMALEVSNTPWLDKTIYTIDNINKIDKAHYYINHQLQKKMHVSPFNCLDQKYLININIKYNCFSFHIDVLEKKSNILSANLNTKFIKNPNILFKIGNFGYNIKVIYRIYIQAFKLFIKKSPIYKRKLKNEPS